jgi:hypothetical protein
MQPMRALQSFCVVNGQARLFGDAPLALVRQSGNLEYIKEWIEGEEEEMVAHCETKRKGDPEAKKTTFSVADAKRANLWGKRGTWTQYPQRMLKYRARSFNLRDNFPDAFGGASIAEEYYGAEMSEAPLNDKPRSAILLEEPAPEPEPKKKKVKSETKDAPPETEEGAALFPDEVPAPYWICHTCGVRFAVPGSDGEGDICPECYSTDIEQEAENENNSD